MSISICGRLDNAPPYCATHRWPCSKTCDCVTLHSKRGFAYANKLRIMRWGDFFDYLGGPSVISRLFIRERLEGWRVVGDMMTEASGWRDLVEGVTSQGM